MKGVAFYSLQEYHKAINCYNTVLKFDPKHVEAWYTQAVSMI